MDKDYKKREYDRHSMDMPIQVQLGDIVTHRKEYLNNISFGGLSFKSSVEVKLGTIVHVKIPLTKPVFAARGEVVWCNRNTDYYDVGVKFIGSDNPFKVRMIEQVCHIQNYKKEVFKKEGRILTGEEAALEWIKKFADKFPKEE
ncbi:MAG: PilZ domain-containing protein [Endomicrobiales bacterium]|nr:PilZ domain-containing protein [Endomicrobiales bacterium]